MFVYIPGIMTNFYKPLTYAPKIEGVKDGTIRQTIRYKSEKAPEARPGDNFTLFTWSGRPYWSKWEWRETWELREVIKAKLFIPLEEGRNPFIVIDGELWSPEQMTDLAVRDGIDPPTYQELLRVLLDYLKGKDTYIAQGLEYYPLRIYRW